MQDDLESLFQPWEAKTGGGSRQAASPATAPRWDAYAMLCRVRPPALIASYPFVAPDEKALAEFAAAPKKDIGRGTKGGGSGRPGSILVICAD